MPRTKRLIKKTRQKYCRNKGARGAEALVKGARGAEALVKGARGAEALAQKYLYWGSNPES